MSAPNSDPRIAPKEMIITRFKSAQQKRQLREKDRSMTKITDLLKSHTKSRNGRKKLQKSPNCNKKVTETIEEGTEYYPNKLKRKFEEKRVFLRPKYESTTVVKLNKRKLGTPQKGMLCDGSKSPAITITKSPDWRKNSPVYSELSMEEVVRLVEDTESLDDDDLMEILTCPSPVWWEDPPNEGYIEESLKCTIDKTEEKRPPKKIHQNKRKINKEESPPDKVKKRRTSKVKVKNIINVNEEIKIVDKSDKFMQKCSKLENLLGNIKNKVLTNDNLSVNVGKNKVTKYDNSKDIKQEQINQVNEKIHQVNKRQNNTLSESTEEDSVADLSFPDDEMLTNLENMSIPVEIHTAETKLDEDIDLKPNNELINVLNIVLKEDNTNIEPRIIKSESNSDTVINVPKNLPPLIKRPKIEKESTMYDGGSCDIDTISDTNITFIMDDSNENNTDIIPKNIDMPALIPCVKKEKDDEKTKQSDIFKAISEKKDFITVYQIVSNEKRQLNNIFRNIPEYSNHVENLIKQETDKGQLNTFFKKCKNVRRKCKRMDEADINNVSDGKNICDHCEPKKSITVARDENVKYCLKCSAIFDTEECSFCSKSLCVDNERNKIEIVDKTEISSDVNVSKDVH